LQTFVGHSIGLVVVMSVSGHINFLCTFVKRIVL